MQIKESLGIAAAELVQDDMIVGLGTGSTAYWAIERLGERKKEGLNFVAVATSINSEEQAKRLGIELVPMANLRKVDLTIDGADEISTELDLIKGGGGALLREKLIAGISDKLVIIADESKWADKLGKFPLPVEVIIFGWEVTRKRLAELGCSTKLRQANGNPFITDNGNYIIDCNFSKIEKPKELEIALNLIPGVVENGLFVNMASLVLLGKENGSIEMIER